MKLHVKVSYSAWKKTLEIRSFKTDDLITEQNDCENALLFFKLKNREAISTGWLNFDKDKDNEDSS